MDPSSQNQQIVELQKAYESIDTQKRGYISSEQLKNYFKNKEHKPNDLAIKQLYKNLPNGQLTQQRFITYMLGHKLNMSNFAINIFGVQKSLGKYMDASAPGGGGVNQTKNSFVKFKVLAKENQSENTDQNKFIKLKVGCDKIAQQQKYTLINSWKDCSGIFLLIKFGMQSKAVQIANSLNDILNNLKQLVSEMAPELQAIINCINISCKTDDKFVYIIIELKDMFFEDIARFLNQLTCILNTEAKIILSFLIQSSFLKNILTQGSDQKVDDLLIQFGLDVDSQSLNKIKQIYLNMIANNQIQIYNAQEKKFKIFISLLNQIQFQANFANSQKLVNEAGIGNGMNQLKQKMGILKDLQIQDTAQGFVPGFGQFFTLLKQNAKGQGQISINTKSCFLMTQFKMEIDGLFDLI